MQFLLRVKGQKTFNVGFQSQPLCGDISPDSLNLLMKFWAVDSEIACSCMLGYVVHELSD